MNGSWNANVSVTSTAQDDEDWDTPADKAPAPKAAVIPTYTPNQSIQNNSVSNNTVEEESWDDDGAKNDKPPPAEIPFYKPPPDTSSQSSMPSTPVYTPEPPRKPASSAMDDESWDEPSEKSSSKLDITNSSMQSSAPANPMEESWDDEPSQSTPGNGFASQIPMYRPNGDSTPNGQEPPNNIVNQRYDNNYHSNKYPSSNRDYQNDPFSRDSFGRNSRGGGNR